MEGGFLEQTELGTLLPNLQVLEKSSRGLARVVTQLSQQQLRGCEQGPGAGSQAWLLQIPEKQLEA